MVLNVGDTVTLNKGNGYYVQGNNLFSRLRDDVKATITIVAASKVYVKLPEHCEYAKQGHARFDKSAVEGYLTDREF